MSSLLIDPNRKIDQVLHEAASMDRDRAALHIEDIGPPPVPQGFVPFEFHPLAPQPSPRHHVNEPAPAPVFVSPAVDADEQVASFLEPHDSVPFHPASVAHPVPEHDHHAAAHLLNALFEVLPEPGTHWSQDDRKAWFDAVSSAMKLVYKD